MLGWRNVFRQSAAYALDGIPHFRADLLMGLNRLCLTAYTVAVERYPHHAALLSESATASERAGSIEQARETARRAVRQDDLNRRAGHSDKFLDGQMRRRMERLAAEPSEPN